MSSTPKFRASRSCRSYRATPLRVLLGALLGLPVFAAGQGAPGNSLEQERARTRAFVNDVSADMARAEDRATALPRELSVSMRERAAAVQQGQAGRTPVQPRAGASELPSTLSGATPVAGPSAQRAPRRSAPVRDASRPVFTPDFSRQQQSFAGLAGRAVVELPRFEAVAASPASGSNGVALSLEELVQEGLLFSPVYRQAQAQLDNARARTLQNRADLFPVLSATVKAGRADVAVDGQAPAGSSDYRTSNARLTQPLYNHTVIHNLRSSRQGEEAAVLRVKASRDAVTMSLVQAVVNLAAQRMVLEFADEQETQLNEVLRYLEERAQAGASSRADLERARARVLAARQLKIEQQAGYRSALYELERLTGSSPTALRLPYLNQLPALPQTQSELRTLVLEHNDDLRALKAEVRAQEALVAAQRGRLYPSLNLSAEHDTQRNGAGPQPQQTDKRLLLVLSWAGSLGGKELYAVREAQAELRARNARLDEELRRIEQAVEADFALLQSASQRIVTGESEQRAANAVVAAVREQLQVGRIGSLLEALDAFDRLYAARTRQVHALTQQFLAQAQLLRRLGTLGNLVPLSEDDPLALSAPDQQGSLFSSALRLFQSDRP